MFLAAPRSDPEKSSRRGTNNDLYKEWKYPVPIQMLIAERLLNVQVKELAEAVVIGVAHCTKHSAPNPLNTYVREFTGFMRGGGRA